MNTLTAATAVLAIIIGLGQLMISMATLSSKTRAQIINSSLWFFIGFMVLLMFISGVAGFVLFAMRETHRTIDYMILAASAANYVGSAIYVVFICLAKRLKTVERRIEVLEKMHSSESSQEGSGG